MMCFGTLFSACAWKQFWFQCFYGIASTSSDVIATLSAWILLVYLDSGCVQNRNGLGRKGHLQGVLFIHVSLCQKMCATIIMWVLTFYSAPILRMKIVFL